LNRLEQLLKLYQTDKRDPFIPYGIALEYLSQNELKKAEEFLQIVIDTDPDYTSAYMQYAQLKANLNKTEEAKQLYLKGIAAAVKTGDKRSAKEMEEFLEELE
jgi:Tfp pilus assembly protein PilF